MKDILFVPCYEVDDPTEKKAEHDTGKEEEEILKAWKRGERNIPQIMEITGYSKKTVLKYIPWGVNG